MNINIIKAFVSILAKLTTLLFISALIYAGENKTFTVGVEKLNYYPQYHFQDGEYTGLGREILDAFAQSKGYTFLYKARPIARLHREFSRGLFDFKYPDNPAWGSDLKQNAKLFYSNPVNTYIDGVMVLPENRAKTISKGYTLGTVAAFTPEAFVDDIESGKVSLKENTNFTALLKMVLNNRVDGAYINIDVGYYQLKEIIGKEKALVFDETLPFTQGVYRLSTVKHPEVIEEFNLFLKVENELVDGIIKKYNFIDINQLLEGEY